MRNPKKKALNPSNSKRHRSYFDAFFDLDPYIRDPTILDPKSSRWPSGLVFRYRKKAKLKCIPDEVQRRSGIHITTIGSQIKSGMQIPPKSKAQMHSKRSKAVIWNPHNYRWIPDQVWDADTAKMQSTNAFQTKRSGDLESTQLPLDPR